MSLPTCSDKWVHSVVDSSRQIQKKVQSALFQYISRDKIAFVFPCLFYSNLFELNNIYSNFFIFLKYLHLASLVNVIPETRRLQYCLQTAIFILSTKYVKVTDNCILLFHLPWPLRYAVINL